MSTFKELCAESWPTLPSKEMWARAYNTVDPTTHVIPILAARGFDVKPNPYLTLVGDHYKEFRQWRMKRNLRTSERPTYTIDDFTFKAAPGLTRSLWLAFFKLTGKGELSAETQYKEAGVFGEVLDATGESLEREDRKQFLWLTTQSVTHQFDTWEQSKPYKLRPST